MSTTLIIVGALALIIILSGLDISFSFNSLKGKKCKSKWIKVEDKLPQPLQECSFANTKVKRPDGTYLKPTVINGYYGKDGFFYSWLGRDRFTATHWWPVPEAPEEENETITD